jgi:lactoylglutathione lyase
MSAARAWRRERAKEDFVTDAFVGSRLPRTGHVGLNVADLGRSRRFYEAAFGFRSLLESDEPERRFVFLGDGDHLVLTLWQQSGGRFDRARPGLHHLSFQVDSVEEVRDYERRLRELGATFLHDGVVAHAEGAASGGVFFEDPDGIRLEIFTAAGVAGHRAPTGNAPTCGFF